MFLITAIILYVIIVFFTFCILIGGNINKSEDEKRIEDEEQIKYLKDYKKRRDEKWKKNY